MKNKKQILIVPILSLIATLWSLDKQVYVSAEGFFSFYRGPTYIAKGWPWSYIFTYESGETSIEIGRLLLTLSFWFIAAAIIFFVVKMILHILMSWKNFNYSTKGGIIGGLVGLLGSLLRPLFLTMNHDPLFIFGIPGLLLRFTGVGGCSWKSSFCAIADFYGYLFTIGIFALMGALLGLVIENRKKKRNKR